jgi:hypothetical protein
MEDCAEAREFVDFVVSRETELRKALYNKVDGLQKDVHRYKQKLAVFELAFGSDVGLFPPPLCSTFVQFCRAAQYDEIQARSEYLAYGRGKLSVLYFERVVRTYTELKGYFTYEEMMKILEQFGESVMNISQGIDLSWSDECLVVHEPR